MVSHRIMGHRVVTDRAGASWQVWSVGASTDAERASIAVAARYAGGWLAFEQTGVAPGKPMLGGLLPEKRRLAPVPVEWDVAPDDALLAWLESAEPVPRRLGLDRPRGDA